MRLVATTLALALCLLGCRFDGVKLATIDGPVTEGPRACFTNPTRGELIVESTHGTALKDVEGRITPLMWPPGFTARLVGSEVEVLDPAQNVVATTGRQYYVSPLYEVPHRLERYVAGCVDPWSLPHARDPL